MLQTSNETHQKTDISRRLSNNGPENHKFSGPLSAPMWEKVKKLDSSYKGQFDWSVYDRLHKRYEKNPVRGGVVFKSTFKVINHHSSCTQCHYAIELDSYGRGCLHNCTYCYAKAQLTTYGYWNRPAPFPIDLAEIRKILYTVFETDKKTKWRDTLGRRIPLRIGCMSDSFLWIDKKLGVTLELLKILKHYRYPYVIATRSDLAAEDEYIAAMDPALASVQYSLTGNDESVTKILEPGAPSLKRRLLAMKKIREAGIWTTARLNPLFPTFPDGYFTDPDSIKSRFGSRSKVPRFNLFDITKLDDFIWELAEHKVPTLMPGVVRLAPSAINAISRDCDVDLRSFYKPELFSMKGDKRYSDPEIRYYYKLIHNKCKEAGIRFTTCYIGNGEKDYYQYQDLWSNKKDCCDALGQVKDFKSTSQQIPWSTRLKHAPCKSNALSSLQQVVEHEKKYRDVLTKYHPEKLVSDRSEFDVPEIPTATQVEGVSTAEGGLNV